MNDDFPGLHETWLFREPHVALFLFCVSGFVCLYFLQR
jgi:hypothetical protein